MCCVAPRPLRFEDLDAVGDERANEARHVVGAEVGGELEKRRCCSFDSRSNSAVTSESLLGTYWVSEHGLTAATSAMRAVVVSTVLGEHAPRRLDDRVAGRLRSLLRRLGRGHQRQLRW